MILIRNINVYSPEDLGNKDILIGGETILAIEEKIEAENLPGIDVIDGTNLIATPGLVDAHVHISGAGGEGGPGSRTAEMPVEWLIEAGITTVIGCLGTDGFTRSPKEVLMKVKAIREDGLSAWMYMGAYQVPTPTVTGEIGADLALLDEVIGAGEIALSDHRSSVPSTQELIKLTEHTRVGAMLGGKAGIVNIHMGDAKNPFKPLYEAVNNSELSYKQFLPTHCNRNHYIFEDSKEYGKLGYVDLTASSYPYFADIEVKPSKGLKELIRSGVPIEHITLTSDANGSLPLFNDEGNLVRIEVGKPKSILSETIDAIKLEGLRPEVAFAPVTINPAKILKLHKKGRIGVNMDADIAVFDKKWNYEFMIARGKKKIIS